MLLCLSFWFSLPKSILIDNKLFFSKLRQWYLLIKLPVFISTHELSFSCVFLFSPPVPLRGRAGMSCRWESVSLANLAKTLDGTLLQSAITVLLCVA